MLGGMRLARIRWPIACKDPANSLPELIANSPMVLILDAIERFDRNDISGSDLSPQLFHPRSCPSTIGQR